MKRFSQFLLFPLTGQFLACFLAFLSRFSLPTCSFMAWLLAQVISQAALAAEILNPATTGPYGAAYPYGYYSELPPNPPEPGSSGNSTNSLNANSATSPGNTPETPAGDSSLGQNNQEQNLNTSLPAPMPEGNPEAKASTGEEKLSPEQKAQLEAALKKAEKTGKAQDDKASPERKGGLLEEMAASRKLKEEQQPSGQAPEVLPESPARLVLKEMKEGKYTKALVDLENLKRLNPQAYELDYLSAINHIMLKQPAQARVYYQKILQSQASEALKQLAQSGLAKLRAQSRH